MRNYAASEIDVTHFPFFQPNPCIRLLGNGLKKKNDYSPQKLRKIRWLYHFAPEWLHLIRPVTSFFSMVFCWMLNAGASPFCSSSMGMGSNDGSAFASQGSKESLQAQIQFKKWRVLLEKPTSGFNIKKDTVNSELQPLQVR